MKQQISVQKWHSWKEAYYPDWTFRGVNTKAIWMSISRVHSNSELILITVSLINDLIKVANMDVQQTYFHLDVWYIIFYVAKVQF